MNWNNTTLNLTEIEYFDDTNYYKIFVPPMLLVCLISIITNTRVLLSVHWIRRPLSPTLHISLSLAAADACTSAMLGIGLFVNSYLLKVYEIQPSCVVMYVLEIIRLSGVIVTVVHLLTLSINHYLGILKPLHYITSMTTRKVTVIVLILWIVPFLLITSYFLIVPEQDYWTNCKETFMLEYKFRYRFVTLFFIPLILMVFCYVHILIIIKKQQRRWAKLSRVGSTRTKGAGNASSSASSTSQQRSSMESNIKAIYTTLLILGSCVIGWLPACIVFLLICPNGCLMDGSSFSPHTTFFLSWFINLLVILKTLVNPIIYSSRMMEIQESTKRMNFAIRRHLCRRNDQRNNLRYRYESEDIQRGNMRNSPSKLPTYRFNGSINSERRTPINTTLV